MHIWHPFDKSPLIQINSFYTFFIENFDNDYVFNGEMHDFWECIYVIDGKIRATNDEEVYHLNKGDIIFHNPMALHKLSVMSDDGATLLIFSYTMEGILTEYFQKSRSFTLADHQQKIISDMLSYINEQSHDIVLPPDMIEHYRFFAPSLSSPIYLQRVTYYIYQLFLSLVDSAKTTPTVSNKDTDIFKSAVKYMLINLHNQPSVDEIAGHCRVSQSGLKRIFNKYSGMSVHKYFINLKLNASLRLLQTGKSVTDVTNMMNFSSQSYFSTMFKRETGRFPSEYKLSIISKETKN